MVNNPTNNPRINGIGCHRSCLEASLHLGGRLGTLSEWLLPETGRRHVTKNTAETQHLKIIGAPLEVWRFRTWKPPFLGGRAVNFREGKVPKMMVFPEQKFTQSSSPLEVFLKGLEHMNLLLCLVSEFYFMRTVTWNCGWYVRGCIGGVKIDAASFV